MVTTTLHGIDVQFPYVPYDCQKAFMDKVILALNQEENAALESPTGTGKTLSLLCSSLAWLQNYKGRIGSAHAEQLALNIGSKEKGTRIAPQIIYASRTHSQLAQVVRELNKTTYRTLSVTTIASRDQLCINERVSKEPDNKLKAHMCRALAGAHKCHYYNKLEKDSNVADELYMRDGKALDIEDLVATAKQYGHCPFFQSRSMKDNADLILLPYNYIIDPRLRNSHKIQLKGNIIIFDEAHNLESVCEESTSVCFSSTDLAQCISEAQEVLQLVMDEIETLREQKDNTTEAFGPPAPKNIEDEINVNDIAQLIVLLQEIEKGIDKLNLDRTIQEKKLDIDGRLFEGAEMIQLLGAAGFRPEMREPISLLIDRIGQFLSKRAEAQGSVFAKTGKSLQEFASFVATVSADSYEMEVSANGTLSREKDPTKSFYLYAEKEPDSNKRKLNYWCFSAGVAMRFLQSRGVRSIIITSGTLSPLDHFISGMGIPFGITLENGHVATPDQICAGSLNYSLNQTTLCGTFDKRDTPNYKNGVGLVVLKTVQVVPQGVLVFFPSYSQMTNLISCWKTPKDGTSLYQRILEVKKIFIEPKSKAALKTMFMEFDQEIRVNSGAVMFAVCRGKVSEGIDFADTHCRAVVIVGIPYPPLKDTRVILKRHFLQQACAKNDKTTKTLNSEAWYKTEGIRAVNQAIGRIIRHKEDFGAVILADPRFSTMPRSDYPSWMRSSIKAYDSPMEFFCLVERFFKDRGLACESSLIRLRKAYEQSLNAQESKIHGLVGCRKRKAPQSFHTGDEEANKRYANELKGLYQNVLDLPEEQLQETALESAMKYMEAKRDSRITMKGDFVGRSDSTAIKDFFESLKPRASTSQQVNPAPSAKRTIKLKSNSRVCDVNSPSVKITLERPAAPEPTLERPEAPVTQEVPASDSTTLRFPSSSTRKTSLEGLVAPEPTAARSASVSDPTTSCSASTPLRRISLERFVSPEPESAQDEPTSSRSSLTSSASRTRSLPKENRSSCAASSPPRSSTVDSVSVLAAKMPTYSLKEYAVMIRSLPKESQKKFVALQKDYTKTGHLIRLLDGAKETLLPDHPNVYKGLYSFVRANHKNSFLRRCSDLKLL